MLIFIVPFLLLVISSTSTAVEVKTSLGDIRGLTLKSRMGHDFYAFLGIHYAQPPVGDLRFKNPVPMKPWKPKVLEATKDGPVCPQPWKDTSELSEDCLHLSVFTRDLNASRPVIVYLHTGAFHISTARSQTTGPQYFMDRDVVLVLLNYRLGSLGMLALNSSDAPGNQGLKDQIAALRWVQAHIKNFGGNPNLVTLIGYSAGSISIGLHMLSPMSRGLFHRGIAMSGSPFGQWTYSDNGIHLAKRQAKLLKCPTKDNKQLLKCLKEKPMSDFVSSDPGMFDFGFNPILNWFPVIENDFGQERYLVEDPYKTMLSGNIHKVPLMTGINEYELIAASYLTLINATQTNMFNKDFEKYAPIAFLYERDTPRSHQISQRLRSNYLKNKPLELPQSLVPFGAIYSDSIISFEYHRFLDLVSRHVPVYTYFFKYKGRYSNFYYPANKTLGAVHHDELNYLFYCPLVTPLFTEKDPENVMVERMTRMWTEFAHKSNPNNPNDEYLKDVNWKLYNRSHKEYLEIDSKLRSRSGGVLENRFNIMDELFPIPHLN